MTGCMAGRSVGCHSHWENKSVVLCKSGYSYILSPSQSTPRKRPRDTLLIWITSNGNSIVFNRKKTNTGSWKSLNPSVEEYWKVHTREYCAAMKMNALQKHVTVYLNLRSNSVWKKLATEGYIQYDRIIYKVQKKL